MQCREGVTKFSCGGGAGKLKSSNSVAILQSMVVTEKTSLVYPGFRW